MVDIPKRPRALGFESGTSVRGVAPVQVDTSLEEAVGGIGKTIESIARRQQNEEDINQLSTAETAYKKELIQITEDERARQGSDTKDNFERVVGKTNPIRESLSGNVHPRIQQKLNNTFDEIDLAVEADMSRLRATGIKVEREQKRDDAKDVSKELILANPFAFLQEAQSTARRYQEEVDAGVTSQGEADDLTKEVLDELAVTAFEAIGEQHGPTAQLVILENGTFDDFISADQKEALIKEAKKWEKVVEQKEKDAVIVADREKKEADLAVYKTNYDATIEAENFEDLPDLGKVNLPPTGNDTVNLENLRMVQKRWVDGELDLFKTENRTKIEQEINDIKTRQQWNPVLIQEQVALGNISGTQGTELTKVWNDLTNNTNTKVASPLNNVIKELGRFDASGALVVGGGDPAKFSFEQSRESSLNYTEISQALNALSQQGASARELDDELKRRTDIIINDTSKNLLDRFIKTVISPFIGVEEQKNLDKDTNQDAVDFLDRNELPVTEANIKLANERLK